MFQALHKSAVILGVLFCLGCNQNNEKEAAEREESIRSELKSLSNSWNQSLSQKDIGQIADIYDSEILYYGLKIERNDVMNRQLAFFKKHPDFFQQIHGEISVEKMNDSLYKCSFIKRVNYNQKTNDYPAYLIFSKRMGAWKLSTESDLVTDANLAKSNGDKIFLPYPRSIVRDLDGSNSLHAAVYLPSEGRSFIITDSIFVDSESEGKYYFYFLTPKTFEVNLSCPDEYGLIVMNQKREEVFHSFWDLNSRGILSGNCEPYISKFKLPGGRKRIFLNLGSSVCGSGTSFRMFDIDFRKRKIAFRDVFSFGAGYSDLFFVENENKFFSIGKVDAECHYSCPSRYSIEIRRISDFQLLKTGTTANEYEDFVEIGTKSLLELIRKKEPHLLN
jgi:hypothetical protein